MLTEAGYAVLASAAPLHVESVRRLLFDRLTPTEVELLGAISGAIAAGLAKPASSTAT